MVHCVGTSIVKLTQKQVGHDSADLHVPAGVRDISQHALWWCGVFNHSDGRTLPGFDDATTTQ